MEVRVALSNNRMFMQMPVSMNADTGISGSTRDGKGILKNYSENIKNIIILI